MSNILQISTPTITTYTQHAHLLAILESNHKTDDWIYSNYIQLYSNRNLNENNWADFYFPMPYESKPFYICKWLDCQTINRDILNTYCTDIIRYIIDLIDNGYYANALINYKYLSKSPYSNNRLHDVLIYGYDVETEMLYCADFMFGKNMYKFSTCSFGEFRDSYYDKYLSEQDSYFGHNFCSYKLNQNSDYEFHIQNTIYWLEKYASSECPEYWNGFNFCNKKNIVWGIDIFDSLGLYISEIDNNEIDIRFYCLMRDHKRMMCKRLEYMRKIVHFDPIYINMYYDLYKECDILIKMILKYNISKEITILNRITQKIKYIKEKEFSILNELITLLK